MVHEATIVGGDRREAHEKMHSTPAMAGAFAAAVRAKRLLLTHFSRGFGNCSGTCDIGELGMREVRDKLSAAFATAPAAALRRLSVGLITSDFLRSHAAGLLETKRMHLPVRSSWTGQGNQGVPVATSIEGNIASLLQLCGEPVRHAEAVGGAGSSSGSGSGTTADAPASAATQEKPEDNGVSDGLDVELHNRDDGTGREAADTSRDPYSASPAKHTRDHSSLSDDSVGGSPQASELLPVLAEYSYPPVKDHTACEQLARAARATFGRHEVLCARDFMTVVIPAAARPAAADAARPTAAAAPDVAASSLGQNNSRKRSRER